MHTNITQFIGGGLSSLAASAASRRKRNEPGAAREGRQGHEAARPDVRAELRRLRRTWSAPPELERSRPRESRLKAAGRVLIVLSALLAAGSVAAGVLMYLTASSDRELRRQLIDSGRDTEATVLRRWATRGDNRRYWVGFEYTAEGRRFEGRVQVGRGTWQRLEAGTMLPVRYLPADPARHVVPGREPRPMPLWLPYVVAGAMMLAAWLVTLPPASQRRLLAEGRPAPAIVTRHEKTPQGVVAHFAFAVLSGATVEGKLAPQKKPPATGSVICILYEPDRVRNHATYPFSLVRVAHEPRPRRR